MNNANHAFRSHLMQQFAAQARNQSRPPLALMSLISEDGDSSPIYTATTTESRPSRGRNQQRSLHTSRSTPTLTLPRIRSNTNNSLVLPHHRAQLRLQPIAPRFSSTAARFPDGEGENDEASTNSMDDFQPNLSLLFQNMLQTRRSTSRFLPYSSSASSSSLWSSLSSSRLPSTAVAEEEEDAATQLRQEQLYWKQVLDRAVQCGCQAPNHKRTEPFTFKRMIAPSPATDRLADIFYHVTLRKQQQQQQQQKSTAASTMNQQQSAASATISVAEMEVTAQRKREKWSQIPAFLVTIVSSPSSNTSDNFDDESSAAGHTVDWDEERMNEYLYEPIPYSPPLTERALEDYASACAATQNVLLSLHSEDVASKWVTGPVIRTRAFRNLVLGESQQSTTATTAATSNPGISNNHHHQYHQNNDRIVALIPVGHYFPTSSLQDVEKTSFNQEHPRRDESVSSSSSIIQQQQQQEQLHHHGHRRRYKRRLHGDLLVDL